VAAPYDVDVSALRPDGRRVAIHTLDVRGRFIRARRIVFGALIAFYLLAPLVRVGGRPAVFLDVEHRRFFLFGATFNAQDVWLVALLAAALIFGLLFVTAWRGRVWCGWGCPQTVFLEALYRPIERLIDGPRARRLKQAAGPWTLGRVARHLVKYGFYVAVSSLIAHAALSLFLSTSELIGMVREGPARHPVAFGWSVTLTALLTFNFGWFREQFCVVLCPYGRLQSVLHDRDSIVVGYDARRGEPRGKLKTAPGAPVRGDCVDCKKCVWACPTGIDIRNGLQMECLACTQCVDACDEVMEKVGRPRGLIRYASLNELAGLPRRVLRPRLYVYAAAALVAASVAGVALAVRQPFEATVVRQPGVPWVFEGGRVRNLLEVHVTNKRGEPARIRLAVEGPVAADVWLGQADVALPPMGDARVSLVISVEARDARPGLAFSLAADDGRGARRVQEIRFVAPFGRAP
jgi:cytochrome c oxidase accessory protein FixG